LTFGLTWEDVLGSGLDPPRKGASLEGHIPARCELLLLLCPFTDLFSRTTLVSRYQKGETSLDFNEARDDGFWGSSGISWGICKQSAPRTKQITKPAPHHSIFYVPDALPETQPTVSKH